MRTQHFPYLHDSRVVLLFDGACGFCNWSVQFVFEHDTIGVFRFASLQSAAGRDLMMQMGVTRGNDSVVLVVDGEAFMRSSAVVEILKRLPGYEQLGRLLSYVPRLIRDAGYVCVARIRRFIPVAARTCALPPPELRARVIDS